MRGLIRLLTCKEASALVSQRHDRKLTLWERCTLKIHLSVCDACRNFVKQTEFMRRALKRLIDR
jgi:predicted anti-sigma-YlaC factor YlaD